MKELKKKNFRKIIINKLDKKVFYNDTNNRWFDDQVSEDGSYWFIPKSEDEIENYEKRIFKNTMSIFRLYSELVFHIHIPERVEDINKGIYIDNPSMYFITPYVSYANKTINKDNIDLHATDTDVYFDQYDKHIKRLEMFKQIILEDYNINLDKDGKFITIVFCMLDFNLEFLSTCIEIEKLSKKDEKTIKNTIKVIDTIRNLLVCLHDVKNNIISQSEQFISKGNSDIYIDSMENIYMNILELKYGSGKKELIDFYNSKSCAMYNSYLRNCHLDYMKRKNNL